MIYKAAALAIWMVTLLIPVQVVVFIAYPPPADPVGFYNLYDQNWLLGLLSLDLLYIINNTLIMFFYLGLFAALKETNFSWMLISLVTGLVGISAYYSSVIAFEMFSLSKQFHVAQTAELKQQLVTAGYCLMAIYTGSSFTIYYVLNAVTLIIISIVMLRSNVFTRSTGALGLASGILMIVPSTAGSLGLVLSLISLIPWIGFSILAAKRLFDLGKKYTVEKEIV